MKILGIDPGSIRCGYGVISVHAGRTSYLASGAISPSQSKPLPERLKLVYDGLTEIISTYSPSVIVIEKIFYAKSVRAAMSLGYARAIALLAAASARVTIHECSALEVKKAVVGYGKAEKEQVQKMVRLILKTRDQLTPDSADALALALCYAHTIQFQEALKRSG